MEHLSELRKALKNSRVAAAGEKAFTVTLGEGDGRAVIRYAKKHGFELFPSYVAGAPGRKDGTITVTPDGEITGKVLVNARDMYVEAPATATLAEVNAATGNEAGLWLPLVVRSDTVTVGDLLAVYPPNAVAPIYGELPRLVLGVEAVLWNGEPVRLGRRTVKGVTGYDLAKLFIGSRGFYGLLIRVRFRLWALPASRVVWAASVGPPHGWETKVKSLGSVPFKRKGRPAVYAEGHPETVDALKDKLNEVVRGDWYEVARGDEALELLRRSSPKKGPETSGEPALDLFTPTVVKNRRKRAPENGKV